MQRTINVRLLACDILSPLLDKATSLGNDMFVHVRYKHVDSIRGEQIENPVLLFLHGGPKYPQIAFARKYQQELEKDFVVVQWNQRGAGHSWGSELCLATGR